MGIRGACRLGSAFFAVAALLQGVPSSAFGQLYTADPYDPEGRGFRQYAYPGANEGYPGSYAARSRIVRPNQFDRADDDLGFPTTGLGARRLRRDDPDRLFGNESSLNEKADRQYIADRVQRERAMLRARLERDPKKRDQMIREAEQQARKGASNLSLSVRRTAPSASTIPPAPSRASSVNAATNRAAGASGSAIPPAPRRRPPSGTSSTAPSGAAAPRAPTSSSKPAAGARANIPPAPSSARSRDRDETDPLPTDVLERSRARDRERERSRAISTRRLP